MTADAHPNNRRPIRWWYLPTLVLALFIGSEALIGASTAAAPLDIPGNAAPADPAANTPTNTPAPTSTPTCGPYSDYVISQTTGAQLVPGVDLVPDSRGDDVIAAIALPFPYHLYEYSPSTSVNASTNGNLQFSSADTVSTNICLSNSGMNATIFPYWDDLRTDSTLTCTGGCGIYTSLSGNVGNRIFTIEWRAVYASNTAQQANFEVRLYESGPKFEIIYGTVDQSGSGGTVGVEHCAGFFTELECNSGVLTSGMDLIIQQPACGTATATSTPAPSTNTPTSTNTSVPTNTFTPIPPTNTFTRTNTPTNTNTPVPTNTFTPVPPTRTPTAAYTNTATNTPAANINAYAHLELGGPSSAPMLNALTVTLGSRINLDLFVNGGSNNINAAQSYMTFTSSILQNVNAAQAGCVLSNTVTGDVTTLDAVLQNEVCNGPGNCVFRSGTVGPGSMAFASGALNNCSGGCPGEFRVAQLAFCAFATGDALVHWQFSPPAPVTRDSEIVDSNSDVVSNAALYTDMIIHVIQSNLVGHLTWQGVAAANRPLVTGTLTLCVGGALQNFSFTTDTNGSFTVTAGLPDGTYHWMVKGGRHLSNSSPGDGTDLIINGGSATQEFGTQRGGDTSADNVVSATDFNVLRNDFAHSGVDSADFDYNLVVNSLDFNILKSNFGQAGHTMACP